MLSVKILRHNFQSVKLEKKIALVIQTNNITTNTLDITTFYNGTSLFDQIFIIRTDKNNNFTSINYKNTICNDFSFPYCIFQNYDDLDHYAFMLSIYYEEDYVFYINENEINTQIQNQMTSNWLDETIYSLENNQIDLFSCIISENNDNKSLSGCLIIKQKWIRKLLTYTTINIKSSSIMNTIYSYLKDQKQNIKINNFLRKSYYNRKLPKSDIQSFTCNYTDISIPDTISVIIPMFKRNTAERMIDCFSIQTFLPSYVIFQQSLHYMEIPDFVFSNSLFPVYYIWSPNWNMKYHARLFTSSIFDTKYVVSNDDDHFIQSKDIFQNIVSLLNINNNAIYAKYGANYLKDFNYKPLKEMKNEDGSFDHGGCIYFFTPEKAKIFLRYKVVTYSSGEDVGFSVTNNIECGTKSYVIDIPTKDTNKDQFKSKYWINQKKSELKTYKDIRLTSESTLQKIQFLDYHKLYHYYVSIGFVPYNYKVRNITVKNIYDGKYSF
ncbi:hypothetical protein WA158_007945 [Blastocystis sp. Blastoise]